MNDKNSAYHSSSQNKLSLIKRIAAYHQITLNDRVINAFIRVPREEFVLPSYRSSAYQDTPLPILKGQTISAIHMVIMYISPDYTAPKIGDKVLEIGAGSGYNSAMFAEMVAPQSEKKSGGHVYGVEIIPELVEFARNNIERAGYSDRVTIIQADGGEGYVEEAPFDIISIAAASPQVPDPLKKQLKIGGRMIVPIGNRFYQKLMLITKTNEKEFIEQFKGGVVFVPLTGKYGF